MGGERAAFRARLPADHVLATFMDEHARILGQLDQLEHLAHNLAGSSGMVFARIEAIGRQLLGAEPHHQREEKVLFPALHARGIDGPPAVMAAEHVELRALKHELVDLAVKATDGDPSKHEPLRRVAHQLVSMLRAHIEKEDTILYPMALATLPANAWPELRAGCDAVGYCCGHASTKA
jgi:hypothetical protein